MHEGHRKRIKDRLTTGPDSLQDHEILEILLFNALPRVNTNPIAHDLIKAFGSLSGVFSAEVEQLVTVDGVGQAAAEYLRCIGLCFARIRPQEKSPPAYFSAQTYGDYFMEILGASAYETLEILCLDQNGKCYFRKSFTIGSNRFVTIDPTEISRILVMYKPYAIVIAHNHPNAENTPSKDDNDFTAQIQLLCSSNHIKLYDHIIIGTNGAFSYFLSGKLDDIKKQYNVAHIINGNSVT